MRIWGFVFTVMLAVCFAHASAPAQEEEPAVDPAQFFAAKAAAGGALDQAMAVDAVGLTKAGLHAVQLALERFAVDHDGQYPQHVNQVVREGYIDGGFYANPLTAVSPDERDAVEVPFGWSDIALGNFSYVQIYDEAGNVTGYILLGYGPTRENGQDMDGDSQPDGVILSLASSSEPFPSGLASFISGGRPVTIDMGE